MKPFTYPLWLLCEAANLIVRPPGLSPQENTIRCYETLFDPLCAETGIWADYTEGYYPTGQETYEEAQHKQYEFILEQCGCDVGTKVLDIGCGNGGLLKRAMERGCHSYGITVSKKQAEMCQKQGFDVVCTSVFGMEAHFEPHQFDVVIMNGPSEHFVNAADALVGNEEQIRRRLFELMHLLLKPGGKLFITCVHFRYDTDVRQVIKQPLHHRFGSYYFYCSTLYHLYAGWLPYEGEYEDAARKANFVPLFERDATHDYFLTSLEWSERLEIFKRKNKLFMLQFLWSLFLKDPRYFFITFLYAYYGVWTWQFRGGETSPMVHKWLIFESNQ